ncbi:MAG: exodeoxyribonuclease III [Planctomycetota bacterium]|jgi:exodeoxyribonuclease-3|nr:exodeoxyribonuclease III [Planctomycetota bacterium]
MRVATFNCNSIRVRLATILKWLDAYSPDILALQETKVTDPLFPVEEFRRHGWWVGYRGEKTYNGVAVVCRKEPETLEFGLGDGDQDKSATRLCHVRVDGLDLVNTYVPQGQSLDSEKFAFKLAWFERLSDYFQRLSPPGKGRVVWVGDLNVAPEAIDVYDSRAIWPHVCHCQEVIDAFRKTQAWGFVDIFRRYLPEAGNFTFWDYRQRASLELNRGWRIDHILASPELAKASTDCKVDREPRQDPRPSDHTFVYADFTLRKRR